MCKNYRSGQTAIAIAEPRKYTWPVGDFLRAAHIHESSNVVSQVRSRLSMVEMGLDCIDSEKTRA